MKPIIKLLLLFAVVLICHNKGNSQGCLAGGILFSTQAQIDNFQADYPGCTSIEGNVTIYGNDISNLTGLGMVTHIGGELEIGGGDIQYDNANPILVSLSGLEGLTSIGGSLILYNNGALNSISALYNLTFLGGSITVQGSWNLRSLTGLEGLTSIGGGLDIGADRYGGSNLRNFIGLKNLTSMGGGISIRSSRISSFTGLELLTTVRGISISQTDLTDFTGLNSLATVNGDLKVGIQSPWAGGNLHLRSLTGLNALTSITGNLFIFQNYALTSLAGLENLTSIGGSLTIDGNRTLTNISGLNALNSIGRNVYIFMNMALANISGLENLNCIDGYLSIDSNVALFSITGLDNIDASSISDLTIIENSALAACEVRSICDYLSAPGGSVLISNNAIGCNSQAEVITACSSVSVQKSLNLSLQLQGLYRNSGKGLMIEAKDSLGIHWGTGIADKITVELHNANNYTNIILSDANVNLSTAGLATLLLPSGFDGTYYITIKHRNSLETVSVNPVSFTTDTITYEFDLPAKVYGNNLVMMADGNWVIYGGDVNQDGSIDSSDLTLVDNDSYTSSTGYLDTDVNGNGVIDTEDMTIVDNNYLGYVSVSTPAIAGSFIMSKK